jgi:hypothetical protein
LEDVYCSDKPVWKLDNKCSAEQTRAASYRLLLKEGLIYIVYIASMPVNSNTTTLPHRLTAVADALPSTIKV